MKSILLLLILLSLLILALAENSDEKFDKKKWLDLLIDVDAPKENATQSLQNGEQLEKRRKNIILFISDATTDTKDVADELKKQFPVHGFCKAFDKPQPAEAPVNLIKLLGSPHTRSLTESCDSLLQSSLASLVEWAKNNQQMTTGTMTASNTSTITEIESPSNRNITMIQTQQAWRNNESPFYDPNISSEISEDKKVFIYPLGREDSYNPIQDSERRETQVKKLSELDKKRYGETKPFWEEKDEAIPPVFDDDDDGGDDEPLMVTPVIRKYKREVYYANDPDRMMLIKPITGNDPQYNKWNMFDYMRRSFLDDIMSRTGIGAASSDEKANLDLDQLGTVREPSYYQLVRNVLNDVKTQSSIGNDNGYLLIINGGRPERSTEFKEGVRYVLNNVQKDNTLVVVTGNCPKDASSDIRNRKNTRFGRKFSKTVPYFASGFRSELLNNVNNLHDIPEAIKNAFLSISSNEKSTRSINEEKQFKISESEEYQHYSKNPEENPEPKYLEYVLHVPESPPIIEKEAEHPAHISIIEAIKDDSRIESTSAGFDETPSAKMILFASFLRLSFKYLLCY